jgi:hypothetical protein
VGASLKCCQAICGFAKPSRQLDAAESREAEQLLETKCVLEKDSGMTQNLNMLEMCEWEITDVEKYCIGDFHIEATDVGNEMWGFFEDTAKRGPASVADVGLGSVFRQKNPNPKPDLGFGSGNVCEPRT